MFYFPAQYCLQILENYNINVVGALVCTPFLSLITHTEWGGGGGIVGGWGKGMYRGQWAWMTMPINHNCSSLAFTKFQIISFHSFSGDINKETRHSEHLLIKL
jgi:hypothetical protein